jgi:CRISPR-associated endonuclease/helicase Cas3
MNAPIALRIDIAFRLAGTVVPRDHGYALFGALSRVLGDLHGASWLAVHPIRGVPRPDGMLALDPHRGSLRLRVEPAEIPRVLPLAGKRLDVDGHTALVGVSSVFALAPAPALTARMVTIKGFMEPEPFREAVTRQLAALEVKARVEVGRRRVLAVAGDKVVGFGVTLRELDEDGSVKVQCAGLGGRQRMGCGVFVPMERRGA